MECFRDQHVRLTCSLNRRVRCLGVNNFYQLSLALWIILGAVDRNHDAFC